uniref:AGL6-like MADS-box transcription factor n=1 Tax=Cryptomeria japonica TaxID=3369 RepID=B2ZX79_CRYJA|nr:AGL6-like MADS-box transcription factor [Cryptomeria japonica]
MGRGKVVLQRIENKINRQVTFSKRRQGILKKAQELAVLCDAEVALVIISAKGKVYDYGNVGTHKTLERYQKCSYSLQDSTAIDRESQNWHFEVANLRHQHAELERIKKHLSGEDLHDLSIQYLQQLEDDLDKALLKVRRERERQLQEQNKHLQKQVDECQRQHSFNSIQAAPQSWDSNAVENNGYIVQLNRSNPVECEPTLQIGYQYVPSATSIARHEPTQNNYIQGWNML